MKKLFLLLCILAYWPALLAQVNSCPDQFNAYNSSGQEVTRFCVGQPIRFKSCLPNTQPDKEYYDFDKSNGVSFSNDTTKSFTYTRPGTYTVTQLINTGQISQKERTFVVVDTPPPAFTATACAQNQVRVTITDNNYNNFLVDFGDGTTQPLNRGASALHQYRQGADLKVKVIASYTGATCTQQAEIAVMALPGPTSPVIESSRIAVSGPNGKVEISLKNLQPTYNYILEQVAGASTTFIDTLKNPANPTLLYTIQKINTNNPVCFRLRITDRCGSNLNFNSNTICNQPLTGTSGNNHVVLTWPAYPNGTAPEKYELYRNNVLLQTIPVNIVSFTDEAVVCGTRYCYQLKAILKNNYNAISSDTCLTAVTTVAPPAGYLSSTFTSGNQVELTFKSPGNTPVKMITYQKSINNSPFAILTTSDKTTISDAGVIPENSQLCYQATSEDNCSKTSTHSNITCPIILRSSFSPNGVLSFNWSEYVGFLVSGSQYFVERVDENGAVVSSTPVTGTTFSGKIESPEQQQYFRIKATTSNQMEVTYSNTTVIRQENSFRIPTAFSPNGDGLNDLFEIKGKVFGNFRLQILDRWGQVIFVSTNPQIGWDGRIKSQDAPVGVYVYSLTTLSSTGQQITKTGSFTLVR